MKLADLSVTEFMRVLASVSPAPGGGSVAALCGGLSAALCAMVARLTTGKEKYRADWQAMDDLIDQAEPLMKRFIELMDEDTWAYDHVVAALRLPRGTEAEQSVRKEAIETASRKAADVPLETLRYTLKLAEFVKEAVAKGNVNCITDAGTAALLIRTAAYSASYNVRINLSGISDPIYLESCRLEVRRITLSIDDVIDAVEKHVDSFLKMAEG